MRGSLVTRFKKRKDVGMDIFCVVVPTRNRHELLKGLLENLAANHDHWKIWLIIVDSSDVPIQVNAHNFFDLTIIKSNVKSAAYQRNIGLDLIFSKSRRNIEVISFLDDDVRVEPDYFELTRAAFAEDSDAIGFSGLAISQHTNFSYKRPTFLEKRFKRSQGKINRLGINVPITESLHNKIKVDWLIGCSSWRFSNLSETRFQSDFKGQSLFEDVIFSYGLSKRGSLYVLPQLRIVHLLTPIERPNIFQHSFSWTINRHRLFILYPCDFRLRYYWAGNFMKLLYDTFRGLILLDSDHFRSALGVVKGSIKVLRS